MSVKWRLDLISWGLFQLWDSGVSYQEMNNYGGWVDSHYFTPLGYSFLYLYNYTVRLHIAAPPTLKDAFMKLKAPRQ